MNLKTTVIAIAFTCATTAASASHIFVTDPSVNGVGLDSPAGFTSPTITAQVGSSLDIMAGFYDYVGVNFIPWTMQLAQTGGTLTLANLTQSIDGSGDANAPLYVTFSQMLSSVGTWNGFLQPLQSDSCPSYRYGNGSEGGGGCGGPSESLFFTLNVTAAAAAVPEPAAMGLVGLALLGLAATRRRA